MCDSARTPDGGAAPGQIGQGMGEAAGQMSGMGAQGGGQGQTQWGGGGEAQFAPPGGMRMPPPQAQQPQMAPSWPPAYGAAPGQGDPAQPAPGYPGAAYPAYPGAPYPGAPHPGAAWGYAPPPAPWPPQPYPYPPAGAMGGPGQAVHQGQGAGRAVHAAAGADQPGQGAGMARMLDEMTGSSGLGNLVQMFNLDDRELWKGALVGAAVVLLLTNDSVQNALFRTGVRARDAAKSGVDQVRTRAAAEAIRRAGEDGHE